MFIKQLSVFIENREGRLEDVLSMIKEKNINIVSLSLADNADYGLLRMIVSKPAEAYEALKSAGFTAILTDVLAVRMSHRVGKLQEILGKICGENINIEYMYALATGTDDASIVIKTSNPEKALELIKKEKIELFTEEDFEHMA